MSSQFGESPEEHVEHGLPEDDSPRSCEPDTELVKTQSHKARRRRTTGFAVLVLLSLIAIGAQAMGLSSLINLSSLLATREALREELVSQKKQLDSLVILVDSATDEADAARLEAARQKEILDRVVQHIRNGEAKRLDLVREVTFLTQTVERLKEEEENLGHVSSQLESMRGEIPTLEKRNRELEDEIADKQTTLDGTLTELEAKRKELVSAWDRLIDVKRRVEVAELRAQKAELDATDSENRGAAAGEQLRRLTAQLEGLQKAKEVAEGELAKESEELDRCRRQVETERGRLIGIMGQIEAKTRESEDLNARIDELDSRVTALAEHEQRLRGLTGSLGDIRDLQVEIKNLEASRKDADNMYGEAALQLERTLERAKRIFEIFPQRIESMENELRRTVGPHGEQTVNATPTDTDDDHESSAPTREQEQDDDERDSSEATVPPAARDSTTVQP